MQLFTIGHSNHPLPVFLAMLEAHGVQFLVDVRKFPRSRYNPHFNREALAASLHAAEIGYAHAPALGGLRKPGAESVNTGLRIPSFRAYADYVQTPPFAQAIDAVLQQAGGRATAFMCAEALPWQCHRAMIADFLVAQGRNVFHIMNATTATPHGLRPWVVVKSGVPYYPAQPGDQLALL